MIAVDTNVLSYAHRRDSPFHDRARSAIQGLAEEGRSWAIPWPCVHEFYSTVTNFRAYKPPTTTAIACAQVEAWMASPSLVLLGETPEHWSTLSGLLKGAHVVGALVHDARVAAICIDHGVSELWTADRDFSRFPRLRTRNPLVG